ncbi:MAG: hypothetical protein ACMXYK_04415 [Candidatus Woesearchaeota archaeon]
MHTKDQLLFEQLNKCTKQIFKSFEKWYKNDSKKFLNKINRDYKESNNFPAHILKQITLIDKSKYHSAVCILRGALPYALLFEAYGWKVHYVICGRKNETFVSDMNKLRFNKSIDRTLKEITKKKVLLIENNIYTGNTPYRVTLELKKAFQIQKPDLYIDYICKDNTYEKNKMIMNAFEKKYIASTIKVSKKEKDRLINEFLEKIQHNLKCHARNNNSKVKKIRDKNSIE